VRYSTLLPNIRPQGARQFTSAQQIRQLEGLAVAIPWGFESPFRTIRFGLGFRRGLPHEGLSASIFAQRRTPS